MSQPTTFVELVHRVRGGDQDAAETLVRRYEAAIRRAVRIQLDNANLRRLLDSADVCQSVLASFFVRAALGQYELDRPQQLLGLLTAMAHNKVIDLARKHAAERHRHDHRALAAEEEDVFDAGSSPSEVLTRRELLDEFRRRLTPEERYLAEQRALGREWDALAVELGGTPEALRKQLARAVDRVAAALGLEV